MYFAMGREYVDSSLFNLKLGGYRTLLSALKAIFSRSVGGEVRDEHNKIVVIVNDGKIFSIEDLIQQDYDKNLRAFLAKKGTASVQYSRG